MEESYMSTCILITKTQAEIVFFITAKQTKPAAAKRPVSKQPKPVSKRLKANSKKLTKMKVPSKKGKYFTINVLDLIMTFRQSAPTQN